MCFNPRYGAVGMVVMPFYVVFELVGPVIELLGYAWFIVQMIVGSLDPLFVSLFFVLALLSGFLLSLGGFMLEELSLSFYRAPGDMRRLVMTALLDNFGYRQLLLLYRVRGMFRHLRGYKAWGRMVRSGFAARLTQGRSLHITPWVVTIALAALLALPVAWLLRPASETRVAILNKTVPFENYREHVRLMWLLSHHKVVPPSERLLWDYTSDYVGYDPRTEQWRDLKDSDLEGRNLVYIADTYGVYVDDFAVEKKVVRKIEHLELSRRIYGGMTAEEAEVITRFVKAGGRLVAEFNSFATPTGLEARRSMEKLLHLRWSGWTARHVPDLADDREVARWIKERWELQAGRRWDLEGPGLIYVHESGRVAAMQQGLDVLDSVALFRTADVEIPYPYWFDIVIPEKAADVRAEFYLPILPPGEKILADNGIPSRFPAILHDDDYTWCYMAGDLADGRSNLGPPWIAGLPTVRRWLAHADLVPLDTKLLWTVYAPLMERIIEAHK
jgi:hypothetical protein